MKPIILSIIVCIFFLCGCIETETRITIEKDGSCTETAIIKAPNIIGNEDVKTRLSELEKNGYTYTIENSGTQQSIKVSKNYKNVKDIYSGSHFDPVTNELTQSSSDNIFYSDMNLFFLRKIVYKETILAKKTESFGEFSPLKNIVSRKRIIDMPYAISNTNADKIEKRTNTAFWDVTSERLDKGFVLEASCLHINYTAIVIFILICIIIILMAGKKK